MTSFQDTVIRIRTVQSWQAWLKARERGVLQGDGRRVCGYWRYHYRWMMAQMARRIRGYRGGFPVWSWVECSEDIRSWRHRWKEPSVLVIAEVPRVRVLVSHYEVWSWIVLNWGFVPVTQEEDQFDREVLRPGNQCYDDLPHEKQLQIEASWERIFDIESLDTSPFFSPSCFGGERWLQGCLEYIKLDEIVETRPFNMPQKVAPNGGSKKEVRLLV